MAQGKLERITFDNAKYIKFPFGWAICWGQADNTADGYAMFTFPVTFKEVPFFVACPYYYTGHNQIDYHVVASFSGQVPNLKGVIYFIRSTTATVWNGGACSSMWIAVGKV